MNFYTCQPKPHPRDYSSDLIVIAKLQSWKTCEIMSQVSFHINGKQFTVYPGETENSNPTSRLVDFIRNEGNLSGTKFLCREGGCGACVCTVRIRDPETEQFHTSSINSCLIPVLSCDGWDISTVERLGNHKDGYDIIQQRLVQFSGTQCGFCTPGMIMNMHGLMQSNPNLTMQQIEDAFDGNICRCTGFRPILDAFKSLAVDATDENKRKCVEYEKKTGTTCPLKESCCDAGKCLKGCASADIEDFCKNSPVKLKTKAGEQWLKPTSLAEALEILRQFVSQRIDYRIIAGNTSTGIFKNDGPYSAFLDVNGIPELRHSIVADKLIIGAGVKLTRAIELLRQASSINGFEYSEQLAKHWLRVANVPVRNAGTIAGNLMIKHAHADFPSDIYLTLQAVGARLSIASPDEKQRTFKLGRSSRTTERLYTVEEFLRLDMNGHLIVSIQFPFLPRSDGYVFRSYKITKRYQNAHAYVNGALLLRVDSNFNVLLRPKLCFGGINPGFVDAVSTEAYLFGKSLRNPIVVATALEMLEKELNPDYRPPDASPEYRRALARNLLYKTILGILGPAGQIPLPSLISGGGDIEHKLTSGQQTYDTHQDEWPLTQPITKLEGPIQCSGEAEYVNDIPIIPGELFGAFVVSTVAVADLVSIDASEALAMPGVVAFVSEKDIPGVNNYWYHIIPSIEEIFIKDKITSAGQCLGLLLAETKDIAMEGVKKVKPIYANVQKPILKIKEALQASVAKGNYDKYFYPSFKTSAKSNPKNARRVITGEFELGGQYHFHMEPQTCLVVPKDGDSLDVFTATQFMAQVSLAISGSLAIPQHNINIQTRRLGGGFGAKISPPSQVTSAAAIGAHVTNRPVRIVMDLETNMEMIGKRPGYLCQYELNVDDNGKILTMNTKIYCDVGFSRANSDVAVAAELMQNCYDVTGWEIIPADTITNKPRAVACRAPGATDGVGMIEIIMEHVAYYLKKDPLEVREANLVAPGNLMLPNPVFRKPERPFKDENMIPRLIEQMKANADYEQRKANIAAFNQANRWVKKGLSVVPMKYPQHYYFYNIPSYVAIYHGDGSIAISHGGIEMGQGINTKAAQVAGYMFKVPVEKIKVKPTNYLISANGVMTGGAITSELVAWATTKACQILIDRMAPIKDTLPEGATWEELVGACYFAGIDLTAHYLPSVADNLDTYNIWGLNLTEVEVDILTGEFKIARLDVIEDAGKSMSPEVDIGQVEGSLIMGMGLWTVEKLTHDTETGQLLTNNSWEYKVPLPKDIPEDFRVTLLSDAPNPLLVHGSKATGEPPMCMSIGAALALKHAINSARQDAGNFDDYRLDTPVTPESIVLASLATRDQLIIS